MPALRRVRDQQHDAAGPFVAPLERCPAHAGDLVAGRQADREFGGLALHDRDVHERDQTQIGIADRDERLHVGQQPCFARGRARRRVARGPPHLRRRSRVERRLHNRPAVCRGSAQHQARRDADVGLLAGHVEGRGRAAGGRHRHHERAAAGRGRDRRPPFERRGERGRTREDRDVCRPVGDERQGAAGHPRLDQRRSHDERHLDAAGAEDLAVDLHGRAHDAGRDARANLGARQRCGHRRHVAGPQVARGQVQHPIVVGPRDRDRSAGTLRSAELLRRRGSGQSDEDHRELHNHHRPPMRL